MNESESRAVGKLNRNIEMRCCSISISLRRGKGPLLNVNCIEREDSVRGHLLGIEEIGRLHLQEIWMEKEVSS